MLLQDVRIDWAVKRRQRMIGRGYWDEIDGKRALEPLRALGEPIADVIGMQPYAAWQTAFDPLLTPGAYNYWKSHNFVELNDGLLHTFEWWRAQQSSAS